MDDDLFNALAHPLRRALLDRLREKDGQTLSELESGQTVTRFAVMKHLKLLEAAHLVLTRKVGREKFHYLNPVPIQEVSDRWIGLYAAPFMRTLSHINRTLEQRILPMTAPKHVWELYIRATPAAVWAILTDDTQTPLWQHFNMESQTDWREGGDIRFTINGQPMIVGKVLEIVPEQRFVHSFSAQWNEEVRVDLPSRVTWELSPLGEAATKLTLTHDDFGAETATSRSVTGGWPEALSRLKTLAETGEAFLVPMPDYAAG